MFNNPNQGFNAPQQQQGFNAPQQQQGFNAPPQQQQGFNAPPQQQQGFNAPPQQQQGFNAPPQQQQGFNAPPQQQQQFNQPPGYNAPPQQQQFQQGGFNAPPQQQQNGFNAPPLQIKKNNRRAEGTKNMWREEKLPMMLKRSEQAGNVDFNTPTCFDDFFGLQHEKEFHLPEVKELTVYYTNEYVVGIECQFKCMGKKDNLPGVDNRGNYGPEVQKQTMEFSFAEHIEEVSGRFSQNQIDRICIKTNHSQKIEVGGNNGQEFKNLLGFGIHTAIAFGGSYNHKALESIYLYHK